MKKNPICKFIAEIIVKILEAEKQLEKLRKSLVLDIKDIDMFNNGFITAIDIGRFLKIQSVQAKNQELYLFINQ